MVAEEAGVESPGMDTVFAVVAAAAAVAACHIVTDTRSGEVEEAEFHFSPVPVMMAAVEAAGSCTHHTMAGQVAGDTKTAAEAGRTIARVQRVCRSIVTEAAAAEFGLKTVGEEQRIYLTTHRGPREEQKAAVVIALGSEVVAAGEEVMGVWMRCSDRTSIAHMMVMKPTGSGKAEEAGVSQD